MKREFKWDGEKIAETIKETSRKHTPKELLQHLDGLNNNINAIKNSIEKTESQKKQLENDLRATEEVYKELSEFETKCEELQINKLSIIIEDIREEAIKTAKEKAEKTINKDPMAYTENQRKQLPYLEYQKLLATNPKTQEKISPRIIKRCLYEEPIFDNPFKD
jgi:predicted nuclease with TOPRIM domain